ncbi:MAG TPA: hypothetical protein DIT28_10440 [Oxalobacteraceae bacterium]|jgi:hypothetical protein|nr:hypothetical protein [Oxalobacteraceae bacterium]HCN89579.1 hypothetical protein [Oxalobacteraceae bacterium]
MRGLFTNGSLTIGAGQAVSGIARKPQMLRVVSGRVWLTLEGVPHDYWLDAGDTFEVMPGRLVVIEADTRDSRVVIPAPTAKGVFTSLLAGLQALRKPAPRSSTARC